MTKTILLKRIDKKMCDIFQEKCKQKNITMTNAIRIFINSIALNDLYLNTDDKELTTIKESQLKIKD